MNMATEKDIDSSSAALRSLAMLDVIVKADQPISMIEIARQMALPKPTVFRLLKTLENAGWVLRELSGKDYIAGNRLARFGVDVMMNNSVRTMRHAILAQIAKEIGETCNMTMLVGNEIMYVDRVETQWQLKIDLHPGTRVPLHCSASGKLLISQIPRSKRRTLLKNLVLDRYTDNTITDIDLLEAELDRIRASRMGIDNEEYLKGLVCIAVPVLDAGEKIVAALALQAPTARLTVIRAMEHAPKLRRAAEAMAATFAAP
ncbi:MAG: transcriptional regulator, IclR family [Herminiimonas sp.]|nr:transcriptional regulator, IclR family [Herminiimonas sp.]